MMSFVLVSINWDENQNQLDLKYKILLQILSHCCYEGTENFIYVLISAMIPRL